MRVRASSLVGAVPEPVEWPAASVRSRKTLSIAQRNAESVFPDPVGATTSACFPAEMASHAPTCAGVGALKAPRNQSWVAGVKRSSTSLIPPSSYSALTLTLDDGRGPGHAGAMAQHTTNYQSTFIEVSEDCPIDHGVEPPIAENLSIAALHYRLIMEHPFELTSDDIIFETYALRKGLEADDTAAREEFFSTGQACLRSSQLAKRYGWGFLHDEEGRVGLVPRESEEYAALAANESLTHTRAMRSSRAKV